MTKVSSLVLVGLLLTTSATLAAPQTYQGDLPLLVDPLFDKLHKQDTVGPEIDPDNPTHILVPDALKKGIIYQREEPVIEDMHPEEMLTFGR